MYLAPAAHTALRGKHISLLSAEQRHASDEFSEAPIITTRDFHMRASSAAGAEQEVLGGQKKACLPHLSLVLLFLSVFTFPSPLSLFVSLCLILSSHAVQCEASNQHQQQDRAEPALSRSKATQQCVIDGLRSQMCSASLDFVCV